MAKKKAKKAAPQKRRGYAAPAAKTPDQKEDARILKDAQIHLKELIDDEDSERDQMLDDMQFCTLDQWPEDIRKERENDVENGPRPCLTIDKINQYIVQVVNDMKQGKPGINVRPQDDQADVETAKVLKGLVRNIEDQSSADIAYGIAAENAVKIGLGFFRITTEYVSDDSFKDQDIFIRPIPNTFSVYLGKHIMPDGSDAERGYIIEAMPEEKFKAEFPDAKYAEKEFDGVSTEMKSFWRTDETVTVVEEYVIKKTLETLHFLADGTTISDADYQAWPKEAGVRPTIQDTRTTIKRQLCWYKMTAVEVLDKRELPGRYIPIVEMVGRESQLNGRRILWGLVRPAKDSLRMYNYWASTLTEKFAIAPKTPFIGAVGQFKTHSERWKKANRTNFAVLEYDTVDVNGNAAPPPQRQGPLPMEAAYFHQMQVIEHDVQTSLGMFKAATGESESQQSGRAILALQRESDTGTYHFGANQGISIRHAGRIIVDLIPHYYDTRRIVRILGEDGEVTTAQIDPEQSVAHQQIQTSDGLKSIHNPGLGKYDVSITVGPSYNTKRMESAATFVELAKGASDPGSAAVLRYLTVKNSDFPYSEEAAKMLKALLPPPVQEAMANGQQAIPPQVQAQMQQLQQQVHAMNEAGHQLADRLQKAESGAAEAQAKIAAERETRMAELQLEREVEMEKAKLARDRLAEESSLRRAIAAAEREDAVAEARLQAQTKIEVAEIAAGATLQAAQIAAAAMATKSAAGPS